MMLVPRNRRRLLVLALAALCAGAPVPSSAQGMFVNPLEERPIGVLGHPAFIAKSGGTYANATLAGYVSGLGMRIAQNSARFPDKFVFTVLNNPELNACARMGGFIYINTGALLWMNDEAELAALIGHEVGHAIRRHPAHSANRQSASTSFLRLLSMRRRSPEQFQQMQVTASLALASYNRQEELDADDLGLQINAKIGLDPRGAARMLYQLELVDGFARKLAGPSYRETPVYLRGHPMSADRVRRSAELAQQAGASARGLPHNRDRFLAMIDGMRLGPSPIYGNRISRVRIVTIAPTDTPQRLAAQMGAPRLKLELLLAINGLTQAADLRPGMKVKILA